MCKWCELVIAVIVLVFSFWQTSFSKWVIVAAAVLLALHSFMNCKCCSCGCCGESCETEMKKPMKKKRR